MSSFVIEEGIGVNNISDSLLIALITFCLSDSFFKSIPLKVESLSCKIR